MQNGLCLQGIEGSSVGPGTMNDHFETEMDMLPSSSLLAEDEFERFQ